YDDGYASPTYPEYTVRATTPMPIYYEVQLNEEEESDKHIVINNPDDVPVLPLHDLVTDNRSQINDPIVAPLEPGTQPKNNCFIQTPQPPPQRRPLTPERTPPPGRAAPMLRQPIPNRLPPNPLVQQPPPPNPPDLQPALGATAANPMEQLLQKPTSRESESAGKEELVDPSNNILDQSILDDVPLPLILNSRTEMPDVLPIEVTYCEATIEQYPIYLILDTGSSKSLVFHEFLKKIGRAIDKPSIRNLIDIYRQRKYPLGVVENLPIVISKVTIPIDIEVTEAKDYTVIVETDWLGKVKGKIDLARGVLEYEWKNEKYQTPITLEIKKKTVSIEGKEVDIERYKEIEGKTLRGASLKNIKHGWKEPGTVYWCEKQLNDEEESCIKCEKLFKGIKTLKCLVDNLNEELGILRGTKEYTNLDKNQQAKVEELMENNKFLFAEGLTQLGRTKEEMHTITLKAGVEPVKQRPYRVSHIENEPTTTTANRKPRRIIRAVDEPAH
ncbi:44712_t:CDS:2, partial [Gigaspora margarita]